MHRKTSMPSLIANLETGSGADKDGGDKIRLVLGSYPDGVAGESSSYPFLTISDSDPITGLLEAGVFTDAGSAIKRVFLLVQKDEYFVRRDDLWPVINDDIDRCWQRAFQANFAKGAPGMSPFVFAEQIGEDGSLLQYRPLLLCRRVQRFFHPPCPECGGPLVLCTDDELLEKNGLEPYSESLSRYLFCRQCATGSQQPAFYVKSLRNQDPSSLRDFEDLVAGFRGLLEKGAASSLPCQGCKHLQECFQNDGLVKERIVVFSFYPFYMMAVEAPSLHSQDFVALLSGASKEEVLEQLKKTGEYGRSRLLESLGPGRTRFLFEKDSRLFSEILYLKLSFLGEFAKAFFRNLNVYKYPDSSLSMDGIWVTLQQENSMLPGFWNFSVRPIEIGGAAPQLTFIPRLPPFFSLYGLAVIWFCTLLANKKQGVVAIRRKISEEMERIAAKESDTFERLLKDKSESEFAPENLFWVPDEMATYMPAADSGDGGLPKELKGIWEKTLALGWSLLKASIVGDANWSQDDFHTSLENLREEIKPLLFAAGPSEERKSDVELQRDLDISRMLGKIAGKWRERMEAGGPKVAEEDESRTEAFDQSMELELAEDDEDEAETVILSPGQLPVDEYAFSPDDDDSADEAPETVIMSSEELSDLQGRAEEPYSYDQSSDIDIGMEIEEDDESESKTVILSPDSEESNRISDISGDRDAVQDKDEGFVFEDPDYGYDEDEDEDGEDLVQTVMLSPDEKPGPEADREEGAFEIREPENEPRQDSDQDDDDDDDFLSETVFLSTGKFTVDSIQSMPETPEAETDGGGRSKAQRPGKTDGGLGKGRDAFDGTDEPGRKKDDDDDDDPLMATIVIEPEDKK